MKTAQVASAVTAFAEETGDDPESVAEGIMEFLRTLVTEKIGEGELLVINNLIECLDEVLEGPF